MLTFMRNKLVSLETTPEGGYWVHGVLDDHLYALEVELEIEADTLAITKLTSRFNRYTTPDCPRALPFLQQALGWRISDGDFEQRVHKKLGRQACRHFANLILECCDCVRKARALAHGELAEEASPAAAAPRPAEPKPQARPVKAAVAVDWAAAYARLEDAPQGFFIDLHLHTSPASPCASGPADAIIAEARRIGLDGVCITDHNYLWKNSDLAALGQKHGVLVLGGNEITTAQGDMVVFGLSQDVTGIITLDELHQMVERDSGFLLAAHPFRGFLTVGVDELGLGVEQAAGRPMFQQVHALETLNSKVTPSENDFSARVAQALGKPATGGSDAHDVPEVGIFATRFEKVITCVDDLITALHAGQYQPVEFRQTREVD